MKMLTIKKYLAYLNYNTFLQEHSKTKVVRKEIENIMFTWIPEIDKNGNPVQGKGFWLSDSQDVSASLISLTDVENSIEYDWKK